MKKWITLSLIIVLLAVISCRKPILIAPQVVDNTPVQLGQPQYSTALDLYIKTQRDLGHIAGMQIAVIRNNDVDFVRGYGYYNTTPVVNQNDDTSWVHPKLTRFMLAELTYPMITMAAVKLKDLGLLDLDADVNTYLPATVSVQNPSFLTTPITMRMLLNGTSSIKDNGFLPITGDSPLDYKLVMQGYVANAGNYDGAQQPGVMSPVSAEQNHGAMAVAAYIIQKISNISINDFHKAYFYTDLGIYTTSWYLGEIPDSVVSKPYYNDNTAGVYYIQKPLYNYDIYAPYTMRSSAELMARYLIPVLNDGEYKNLHILDSLSVLNMNTLQYPLTSTTQVLGWSKRILNGRNLIGIDGTDVGVTNRMYYDENTKIGVVILTNSDGCDAQVDSILNKAFELSE